MSLRKVGEQALVVASTSTSGTSVNKPTKKVLDEESYSKVSDNMVLKHLFTSLCSACENNLFNLCIFSAIFDAFNLHTLI